MTAIHRSRPRLRAQLQHGPPRRHAPRERYGCCSPNDYVVRRVTHWKGGWSTVWIRIFAAAALRRPAASPGPPSTPLPRARTPERAQGSRATARQNLHRQNGSAGSDPETATTPRVLPSLPGSANAHTARQPQASFTRPPDRPWRAARDWPAWRRRWSSRCGHDQAAALRSEESPGEPD
jgi:hypothetical protein